MPNLNITKPELVWPGKYDESGKRVVNRGAALPFQVIETIREGRATRAAGGPDLFAFANQKNEAEDSDTWHNKLIWGDNLLVMSSLLQQYGEDRPYLHRSTVRNWGRLFVHNRRWRRAYSC